MVLVQISKLFKLMNQHKQKFGHKNFPVRSQQSNLYFQIIVDFDFDKLIAGRIVMKYF